MRGVDVRRPVTCSVGGSGERIDEGELPGGADGVVAVRGAGRDGAPPLVATGGEDVVGSVGWTPPVSWLDVSVEHRTLDDEAEWVLVVAESP